MSNPNDAPDFWDQIFSLGKVLAPWLTVGWTMHQLIGKVFKYFSDSRDTELRSIVKTETQPKLDEINDKIDAIQKSLWDLSKNK